MSNPFTWLSRRRFPYEPLITVELSKTRLIHNLQEFKKIAPHHSVAPVLKSNAYGHGLREIAHILENYRRTDPGARNENGTGTIPFFVVDSYFEALSLRSDGIHTPLLIIGYTRAETILHSHLERVAFTVTSLEMLQQLENTENKIIVHLKIDTGMRRQGILPEEIQHALDLIADNPLIKLEGICSHLFDSDNADPSHTEGQIHSWNALVQHIRTEFPLIKYIHLSNTDGHRYTTDIDANVSRLGLGLYGMSDDSDFAEKHDLRPVLEMKTSISSIKKIKRDDTVGYSATFKAASDMTIATIPAGYFEGIDRRLSNNGVILVGAERTSCPIAGRVSMNITTIDISRTTDAHIGTPVLVISNTPADENSIRSIAKKCGTISHEIAVHIPLHLKRVVVE